MSGTLTPPGSIPGGADIRQPRARAFRLHDLDAQIAYATQLAAAAHPVVPLEMVRRYTDLETMVDLILARLEAAGIP